MQAQAQSLRIAASVAVSALQDSRLHARADYVRHVVRVYVVAARPGDRIACEAVTIAMDHRGTVAVADVHAVLGK